MVKLIVLIVPSQLGGGDLDGDLFHVIFDERLIPSYTMAPSEYEPAQIGRAHV